MRFGIYLLLIAAVCFSCKQKAEQKKKAVTLSKILNNIKKLNLGFEASDTSLAQLSKRDTISYTELIKIVPDSIFKKYDAGKGLLVKPVGRFEKDDVNYIILILDNGKLNTLVAIAINEKNAYAANLELLQDKYDDDYSHIVNINKEPTFTIRKQKINSDQKLVYTQNGYAFSGNSFNVVIADTNEDETKAGTILNPIDTVKANNKFSGDYVRDTKNFISVRDGKNANSYVFFVHFENSSDGCGGVLKGEINMKTETTGEYRRNSDPCGLGFTFTNENIEIKEFGSCGNHRGVKCFFNDTFEKKKN